MDTTRTGFQTTKTQRGFTYAYYFTASSPSKPTLLFAHGFPSPAYLWRKQIAFLEPLGFGIIAPDLLGYGGTDKPTDSKAYVGSGMAQDVVDILDAEGIEKVIAIGHDWGVQVVSRLITYHPNRLLAVALLAVGFLPPAPVGVDFTAAIKERLGYDAYAYQRYFVEPGAHLTIEKNFDSFFSLLFPLPKSATQPEDIWLENMCVDGKTKAWIEGNRTTELVVYISPEDKEYIKKTLLDGGMEAPLATLLPDRRAGCPVAVSEKAGFRAVLWYAGCTIAGTGAVLGADGWRTASTGTGAAGGQLVLSSDGRRTAGNGSGQPAERQFYQRIAGGQLVLACTDSGWLADSEYCDRIAGGQPVVSADSEYWVRTAGI